MKRVYAKMKKGEFLLEIIAHFIVLRAECDDILGARMFLNLRKQIFVNKHSLNSQETSYFGEYSKLLEE